MKYFFAIISIIFGGSALCGYLVLNKPLDYEFLTLSSLCLGIVVILDKIKEKR